MPDLDAAQRAHEKASALIDDRRFQEAIEPAHEACRLRPDWSRAWWNYAVALKHGHRWADCLDACDRAIALDPEDSGGALWNAGIAATALGDWSRARAAWTGYGLTVPGGDGPLEMELGSAGVRVSLDAEPEVVFGARLDPCRIRLLSVPLPDSNRRFGDIVLHDGEARGTRRVADRKITVFDELLLLQPSEYGTWLVQARCRSPDERDAMVALFDDVDGAIEDWTESLVMLCARCSLGDPHDDHDHDDHDQDDHDQDDHDQAKKESWSIDRTLGLALRNEHDIRRLRHLGLWWRRGVREVRRVL